MALVRSPRRLDVRFCLSCGHDGPELQRAECPVFVCDVCGADLYARPPRSYRELEGLDDACEPGVAQAGFRGLLRRLTSVWGRVTRRRQRR